MLIYPINADIKIPANVLPLVDGSGVIQDGVSFDATGLVLFYNYINNGDGSLTQVQLVVADDGEDLGWHNVGNGMYSIRIPESGGGTLNNDGSMVPGWITGVADGIQPFASPMLIFGSLPVSVGPEGITSESFADDAIWTDVIADNTITAAKIAAGAITASEAPALAALDVASSTLATASALSSLQTTANNINTKTTNLPGSPAAVGSAMTLADGAISAAKIVDGAMTAAKFASGAFDAVWSVATRLLTAGTNIVLAKGTGVTGFNDPTAATTASAVRTELSTELGRIDAASSTRASQSSVDTLSTAVTSIQNNTRCVRVVPNDIELPASGTRTYIVELLLYDEVGNMEAPDSAPTVALYNQALTDRSSYLASTTMTLVSAGRYRVSLTIAAGATKEQLIWAFSVVEGGATRVYGNTSYITDAVATDFTSSDRTTLNAIAANADSPISDCLQADAYTEPPNLVEIRENVAVELEPIIALKMPHKTYYVAASGGLDGNSGNRDYPFATHTAAEAQAVPGDTIHLLGGLYTTAIFIGKDNITLQGDGDATIVQVSSGAAITVATSGGTKSHYCTVRRLKAVSTDATSGVGINAASTVNTTLEDLTVVGTLIGLNVDSTERGKISRVTVSGTGDGLSAASSLRLRGEYSRFLTSGSLTGATVHRAVSASLASGLGFRECSIESTRTIGSSTIRLVGIEIDAASNTSKGSTLTDCAVFTRSSNATNNSVLAGISYNLTNGGTLRLSMRGGEIRIRKPGGDPNSVTVSIDATNGTSVAISSVVMDRTITLENVAGETIQYDPPTESSDDTATRNAYIGLNSVG